MLFKDGYLINAPVQCRPAYRISPFTNEDIHCNKSLVSSDDDDHYFRERFGHLNYCYTSTGRDALNKVFTLLGLKKADVVTILTTTGNHYISSCVTSEIERFCSWNREVTTDTSAILVNHEFGYPYSDIGSLRRHSIPIIEDCAHSFASSDQRGLVGSQGDYAIFSLSKYFPIQFGGLLVSNSQACVNSTLGQDAEQYIKSVVSYNVPKISEINRSRIRNHEYLLQGLSSYSIKPRIPLSEGSVPGTLLFSADRSVNFPGLKQFMQDNGVESSVFYGESGFFVPVHQQLTSYDLDYFVALLAFYLDNGGLSSAQA